MNEQEATLEWLSHDLMGTHRGVDVVAHARKCVNGYPLAIAALREIANSPRGYTGNPYTTERCPECADMQEKARAALVSNGAPAVCAWILDDEDNNVWKSSCLVLHRFDSDGPVENP